MMGCEPDITLPLKETPGLAGAVGVVGVVGVVGGGVVVVEIPVAQPARDRERMPAEIAASREGRLRELNFTGGKGSKSEHRRYR